MPASGLIGIRMVFIRIRFQTKMWVILDVYVYVQLSLEIYWRLVASRLDRMAVTQPGSCAAVTPIQVFTITRVHVCNCIPIFTIHIPVKPNAGVCALRLLSVLSNRYFSRTGFTSYTTLRKHHIMQSTIEIKALQMTYWSVVNTRTDIDRIMIRLNTLMAAV